MTDYTKFNVTGNQANVGAGFDAGLRSFMLKVYNYMGLALLVSGSIAYFAGTSPTFLAAVATNPILSIILMFAPLGFVLFMSFRVNKMSLQGLQITYWLYSVLMGLSLFYIFAVYTQASVFKAFLITGGTFGAMSLYGYTTKKDLTAIGSFLIMGLFGLIIASIVNIFLKSSGLEFALSFLSVGIFVGLTAYDTQKIKDTYYMVGSDSESSGKYAIMAALNLYLDFINLLISILRFVGDRRS